MARFFVTDEVSSQYVITGENAAHIIRSLRMKIGEELVLCDTQSTDHVCKISEIRGDSLLVDIISKSPCPNEASVKLKLFQGLPKGDKIDTVVQKAVEMGVCEIYPCITSRCISRPDEKSTHTKAVRLQKIAAEAACQSQRGIIPKVHNFLSFEKALKEFADCELPMVFYENGGEQIVDVLNKSYSEIAIFVGPEGGFEQKEIDEMIKHGARVCTLGKRILRTETASVAASAVIMHLTKNL